MFFIFSGRAQLSAFSGDFHCNINIRKKKINEQLIFPPIQLQQKAISLSPCELLHDLIIPRRGRGRARARQIQALNISLSCLPKI